MTVDRFLEMLATNEEATALVVMEVSYTYGDLLQQVDSYTTELENIVHTGQVVAVNTDYNFLSIALLLALAKLKCIVVPIVTDIETELTDRLMESQSTIKLTINNDGQVGQEHWEAATITHPMIEDIVAKGHSGLILFSSGSTGKPKAMIHDLHSLVGTYLDRKSKKLCILVFLMFDHIGGLNTLLGSLAMNAKLVLPNVREPEHIGQLIEREGVNVLPASPTFLNLMLIAGVPEKFNLRTLKMITYGTEPMPASLLARLKTALPRTRLLQTFGTSETGIAQTTSKSSSSTSMKIDDPNLEYKIVEGELWLRSKTQVLGYLNADMEAFTEDGWFKTGDLVELDDDGYLSIIGRSKEVINVGGEKVLPTEVESVLLGMDAVLDCMVFGEKNALTGQHVVAEIVLADGTDQKQFKRDMRAYCRERLEAYKIPAKLQYLNATSFSARFKKMRLKG